VHIANKPVLASPWGLSDVVYLIDINRRFNETATMILDIIDYHTAPVTVVTGAAMNNLEKGANKMWAIRQKDAKVENLTGGADGLAPALEFLDRIKVWMHEISGVPQQGLGESQPVSNTSGVALAIQYLPTMMQYSLKKTQYGRGFEKISEYALRVLFTHEPWTVQYDPTTEGIMRTDMGQMPVIDPEDPDVYKIKSVWEPPLPIDTLIKLQELQAKMALSLESKTGALRELGYQFPDEKRQELFIEQIDDIKMSAAQQILQTHIAAATMAATGINPLDGAPQDEAPTKEGETAPPKPQAQQNPMKLPPLPTDIDALVASSGQQLFTDLLTQAYGTRLPSRQNRTDENDLSQGISG
jgi:hypothetical protein